MMMGGAIPWTNGLIKKIPGSFLILYITLIILEIDAQTPEISFTLPEAMEIHLLAGMALNAKRGKGTSLPQSVKLKHVYSHLQIILS